MSDEALWEALAEAITAAGEAREALFLAKLALLLGRELPPERTRTLIALALRDLE
jgi:hypothetical protein